MTRPGPDPERAGRSAGSGRGAVRWRVAVVLALVSALAVAPAAGQGAGSAATTVLRLAPGPRPLALGNALVAVSDPMALEYNPAAAWTRGADVAAAYQALPVDVAAGAAAARLPAGPITVAASLRFVDYGEVAVIEPDPSLPAGNPTGATASGGELTALLGGAARVGRLRVGLAARWLRLDVAGLTDQATAADAGLALDAAEWLAVGASVQNLGGELEAGRPAPLPRTVRVGVRLRREAGAVRTLLSVEGRRREQRTGLGLGLEVGGGSRRVEAVGRVGYETRPDPGDAFSPLVFGGGVRIDRLSVDLAYRALGPLGSTRQVGLAYRF